MLEYGTEVRHPITHVQEYETEVRSQVGTNAPGEGNEVLKFGEAAARWHFVFPPRIGDVNTLTLQDFSNQHQKTQLVVRWLMPEEGQKQRWKRRQ